MWRRKQDPPQDVESTIQRLRDERPQASPLELDQIKTTAMARAGARLRNTSTSRRLVTSGLVVGLMAAGTGGVIAAGATSGSGGSAAHGAVLHSTTTVTVTSPGGITIGNGNQCILIGNGNTFTCNIVQGSGPTITISAVTTTVTASSAVLAASTTVSSTGGGGVLGVSTTKTATAPKARVSQRALVIRYFKIPPNTKVKVITVTINGKAYKFILNGKKPVPLSFKGLPCATNGLQVVHITTVSTSGKVYHDTRTYHLCVPSGR